MKGDAFRTALGNALRAMFPELGQQTHLPLKARVTAVNGSAGDVGVENGPRRYSVDVQPLNPDGTPDDTRAPLRDVALEMSWPGPQSRGVYHLPDVGSIVRVAFYGGSAAHPYVEGVVPDGYSVPAVEPGEWLLQQSPSVRVRVAPDGEVQVLSDVRVKVFAPEVELGGEGGLRVARLTDEVLVEGVTPGSGTAIGKIVTASEVVTST